MIANCVNIFKINYDNREYDVYDFYEYCKKKKLISSEKIKQTTIIYNRKSMTYEEYQNDLKLTAKKFGKDKVDTKYLNYPDFVYLYDEQLFNCLKFIESLCENISAGYNYAMKSYYKIPNELFNIKGYAGYFFSRCLDFSTSILWYNTAYSYFLQVFCTKFNFYSKITKKDTSVMDFMELVSLCKINRIKDEMAKIPNNSNNKELYKWWKKINEFGNKMDWLNNVANSLKHNSGVSYNNLDFSFVKIQKGNKKMSDAYKKINVDIDTDFQKIIEAHKEIAKLYSWMVKNINKEIDEKKSNWNQKMNKSQQTNS